MKLPDNFQMREHLRPCRFHISRIHLFTKCMLGLSDILVDEQDVLPANRVYRSYIIL
jgi:hypothetical protein